ncbi:MAG: NADH-quinone oxidoreductase subunit J [Elusimicrobiota bacterium]
MIVWTAVIVGVLAVAFAGVMLLHRSLYVCSVCLLAVLLQTGVLFLLCGSPLVAFLHIMIYAGAVMVLVVVAVMAAGSDGGRFSDFSFPRPLAWLGLLVALMELAFALSKGPLLTTAVPSGLEPANLGAVLFKQYALATEAVTLLMFLAALAVVPDKEAA